MSGLLSKSLFTCLLDLAFRSRLALPIVVSAGLMFFDLHLRLELDVEAHIQQHQQARPVHAPPRAEEEPLSEDEENLEEFE